MKVSFYLQSKYLGNFSLEEFNMGNIGLSGTDAQFINRIIKLNEAGIEVTLYTDSSQLTSNKISIIYSDTIREAIDKAKYNSSVLIFNNKGDDKTIELIKNCEENKLPCIVWDQNGPNGVIEDLLAKSSYVKRLICVSKSQLDFTRDHPVFYKSEYIYNSIETEKYYSKEKDNNKITFLGSLTHSKGFHHLAKDWKKVREEFPNTNLYVIGSGKLYDRNQKLGRLGIAEKKYEDQFLIPYLGSNRFELEGNGVFFLGLLSPLEIREVLSDTAIGIVNPNLTGSLETFCVSAIEMEAAECPVIGANRMGLRETVNNGKTGLLINNENELLEKIIILLKNEQLRIKMGKEGREYIRKNFDEKLINKKWLNLINEISNNEPIRTLPFSFQRATTKIYLRELIRLFRKLPIVGKLIPTINQLKFK